MIRYTLLLSTIVLAGCATPETHDQDLRESADIVVSLAPDMADRNRESAEHRSAERAAARPPSSHAAPAVAEDRRPSSDRAVESLPVGSGSTWPEPHVTIDDLVRRDRAGSPVISPDGTRIAFVILTPDFEENRNLRDIWMADIATGETRRLTTAEATDTSPVWSPTGDEIAFVSSRTGTSQIWLISLRGGEALQLTNMPVSVSRPCFSPDGTKIAFLARKTDENKKKETAKGRDMKVLTALEDRSEWAHIWIIDLDEKKPRCVTSPPHVYEDMAWSPDSESLAFTCDEKGTRGVSEDSHVAIMPAEGGPIERITGADIFAGAPSWSHDGKKIAYFRDRDVAHGAYLNVKDLYIYDISTGEHLCITSGAKVAVGGYLSIPHTPAAWSADDRYLYLLGAQGATQNVYRIPAGGGPMAQVTGSEGEIYAPTYSSDRQTMAFLMGSFTRVVEVCASPTDRFEPTIVTNTMEPLERFEFRAPERLSFESADGLGVEGFLFYPDGYEKGERVPLVVDIHGGPASRWGAQIPRFTPWRVYNALGIAILIVNPRGSTGYGARFQQGNFKGFGQGDMDDIMAGVDHVIAMGVADPERLGVTGYSYGGFMTNCIITATDRFRAAVSIAGGSNYISCYCQCNPVLPRVFYDGPPWGETATLYFEHSPIIKAHKVTTPVLFMHGEKDSAVDVSQSIEFFRALSEVGATTELVLYPRESHSIAEPVHWRDYMERTVEWFKKYL